jgi:hypothetical protein
MEPCSDDSAGTDSLPQLSNASEGQEDSVNFDEEVNNMVYWYLHEATEYDWQRTAAAFLWQNLFRPAQESPVQSMAAEFLRNFQERGIDLGPDPSATSVNILTAAWEKIKVWESLKK